MARSIRNRIFLFILLILSAGGILTVIVCCSSDVREGRLQLTEEERAWLQEHPVVRLAPDPDFPPVEFFDDQGHYRGIAADLVALIEKQLPLRFEIVHLKNWDEVLRQGKNRQIDMFGAAVPTPERLQYMKFTRPFVTFPAVLLVRDNILIPPRKVNTLVGMHVAVVSGYAAYEYMRRAYPQVKLEVMPDISSGLRQVSFGKVDAMISLKKQVNERTAELKNELAERIRTEKEKEILQQKIHRSKKMEALGLLAGGVAHDLNNIFSGIVGYPDLTERGDHRQTNH